MDKKLLGAMKYWLVMWFTALTVVCAGFYVFIKARQTTNPTTDSDPNSLYTNSNEILKASKRNALVDKFWWVKIKVFTGALNSAWSYTFSHWLWAANYQKIVWFICWIDDQTPSWRAFQDFADNRNYTAAADSYRVFIPNNDTSIVRIDFWSNLYGKNYWCTMFYLP